MTETKKVIATLTKWDSKNNNGELIAEGINPPSIFLNKATLQQKKCTNLSPKIGDVFEVEIQEDKYKGKPSWKIMAIKAIKVEKKLMLQNFAIKLHKTKIFDYQEKKENGKKKLQIETNRIKDKKFGDLKEIFGDSTEEHIKAYYEGICERDRKIAEMLTAGQFKAQIFTPDPHLIIGLGGGSVYETGITLHHVYGFPYIPASSLKGALRSYLIKQYFDNNEGLAFKNQVMCDIFGCPKEINANKQTYPTYYKEEKQGKIIFFDAMPKQSPAEKIKLDIMNPHYSNYYGQNQAPDDLQNPVPIFFLRVMNIPFQVIVGLQRGVVNEKAENFTDKQKQDKDLLTLTAELLAEALENHGIGAKTALGYGYMKKITQN